MGSSVQEFLNIQTTGRPQIVVAAQPLPIFNGDSRGAANWLREYNDLAEDNGYSTAMKWSRVRNSLTGNAKSWFKLSVQRDESIDSWDKFVKVFKSEFLSEVSKRALRQELLAVEQGDELPLDYLFRVQGLCLDYDEDMDTVTILDYVRRGLSKKYRESLAISGRNTLADATKLFRTLQEDITAFTTPSTSSEKDEIEQEDSSVDDDSEIGSTSDKEVSSQEEDEDEVDDDSQSGNGSDSNMDPGLVEETSGRM